jgi:hypothetical protein
MNRPLLRANGDAIPDVKAGQAGWWLAANGGLPAISDQFTSKIEKIVLRIPKK